MMSAIMRAHVRQPGEDGGVLSTHSTLVLSRLPS